VEVKLPILKLRPYQQILWDRWFTERPRMMSLEWARRHGKDLFSLNIMVAEAISIVGNYWHILPESQQIRNAIWEGITKDGCKYLGYIPEGMIFKVDNQSMKIYLRNPNNPDEYGSIISFVGGDRYDKRVGAGLRGVVISEHSLQKPNLYDLAVEPMLKETGGWAIFNYTPRGENHATKMFDYLASKPDKYIASRITNNDTHLVSDEELQEERGRGKPEELIQQEYYCSREGAIFGSYYGDILKQHKKDNVGKFGYDSGYPVHTLWDLGISDSMSIWFIQFIQKDIHIIDFYENNNYALGHYASVCAGKGYVYAMHHIPHDGAKRQLTESERAVTIEQQLKNLGVTPIRIHPPRADIYGAIQRVRSILPRCKFNLDTTADGYEALKQYRREWDEGRQVFKRTPLHDWTSHASDAFSILPMIESIANKRNVVQSKVWNGKFR
jgi:phage terminase large subunit